MAILENGRHVHDQKASGNIGIVCLCLVGSVGKACPKVCCERGHMQFAVMGVSDTYLLDNGREWLVQV